MKNRIVLFLATAILFASCKDKPTPPVPDTQVSAPEKPTPVWKVMENDIHEESVKLDFAIKSYIGADTIKITEELINERLKHKIVSLRFSIAAGEAYFNEMTTVINNLEKNLEKENIKSKSTGDYLEKKRRIALMQKYHNRLKANVDRAKIDVESAERELNEKIEQAIKFKNN